MASESWFFQVSEQPLDLDWPTQGDRFMHLVFEELARFLGDVHGRSMTTHLPTVDEPVFYLDFAVTSSILETHLCLVSSRSGGYVPMIRSNHGPLADQSQILPWMQSLLEALKRMGETSPSHAWSAVIGPVGTRGPRGARLADQASLGGLLLRPSSTPYGELVESEYPSLGGASLQRTFPVVVDGQTQAYSLALAHEIAAEKVNLLCAIVSLALDSPWRIRQIPNSHDLQPDPNSLPPSLTMGNMPLPDREVDAEPMELPDWTESAFEVVEQDAWLRQLILAHHQGLLLGEDFPSFALIAFVGVIESIGSRITTLRRCECCDACSTRIGYARQFRDAVALVRDGEQAKALERMYTPRSQTAHEGRLHGGEERRGGFTAPRFFTQAGSGLFRFTELLPLQLASKDLLVLAITGQIPALVQK